MAYISFENVTKNYKMGEVTIPALSGASFAVEKGQLAVILGASGAGKTTALNILGGMETATDGAVYVDGRDITRRRGKQLIRYRREEIGFVFQSDRTGKCRAGGTNLSGQPVRIGNA